MKTKNLFLLFLLVTTTWTLEALPLGNPAEAYLFSEGIFFQSSFCNCLSVRAGYYGDYVFDRKLHVEKKGSFGRNFIQTKVYTNAGYLTVNLWERLDIFTTLGGTKISIENDQNSWTERREPFPEDTFLLFNDAFSWSIGGRAALLKWGCWTCGLEGQYFTAYPKRAKNLNYIDSIVRYINIPSTYNEWQIGGALSYEINSLSPEFVLVPYFGIKGGHARLSTEKATFRTINFSGTALRATVFNSKSKFTWGFPIGITLLLNHRFDFTLEGRYGDETAFSVMTQARF